MGNGEAMFREDAEKLARQIENDDPMVEILDVRLDPEVGGYVIVVHDRGTDEQYTVDHYETWAEKSEEIAEERIPELVIDRVHEKHGKKIAHIRGNWADVAEADWPDDICDAFAKGHVPGEKLVDVESSLLEIDLLEPGHGSPRDYGVTSGYLALSNDKGRKVWRRILKMANFTLEDQSKAAREWLDLGFEIEPKPLAPLIEVGRDDWDEEQVLQEVRDRLLDISDQGFEAILVDGPVGVAAYAWVMAGVMGLKVVTSWSTRSSGRGSGSSSIGYSELMHYLKVAESL